jgi:hypothetical protein
MAPRNQADLWRDLVAEAGDDAALNAAQVTSADAERELAAAGFDVAEERAKAAAHLRALDSFEAPSKPEAKAPVEEQAWVRRVPPASLRERPSSPRWVWLVAATLALATMGGLLYGLAHRPKPVDLPREVPTLEVPAPTAPAPSGSAAPVAPREAPPMMGTKPH